MPVFEPRTADEILRSMLARLVATSALSDINEGSAEAQLLGGVSAELSSKERQLQVYRDSFYLEDVIGSDLDYRMQELPPSGLVRHAPQAASGGGPVFTRTDSPVDPAPLVIPAGSLFGRSDSPGSLYQLMADVTIPGGLPSVADGILQCTTSGADGNAPSGAIDTIVSAPSDLLIVRNLEPMSNGDEGETDDDFRARGRAYLSSLGQSTPAAVQSMALNYVTADGDRASYVALFEDPNTPGYSELLLDDGDQLDGRKRLGAPTGLTTVGNVSPTVLFHEKPAVDPITYIGAGANLVVLTDLGAPVALQPEDIVSIPERGIVHIRSGVLLPGYQWSIGVGLGAYNIWTGLPAEIQEVIEGDRNSATNRTSFRGSGCRVRVVQPAREDVDLQVQVLPIDGGAYESVKASTIDSVISYMATLLPGRPLYIAQLIDHIMDLGLLQNIRFYSGGAGALVCAPDQYPSTPRTVLRATTETITATAVGA